MRTVRNSTSMVALGAALPTLVMLASACPLLGVGDIACREDAQCPSSHVCIDSVCRLDGASGGDDDEGEADPGEGEGDVGEGEGDGEGEGEGGEGEGEGEGDLDGDLLTGERIVRGGGFGIDYGHDVQIRSDGVIVLAGTYTPINATVGSDGDALPDNGGDDGGFIAAFEPDGSLRWVRAIGGILVFTYSGVPAATLARDESKVIVAGSAGPGGTFGLGDDDAVALSGGGYVAALDIVDGSIEWLQQLPGEPHSTSDAGGLRGPYVVAGAFEGDDVDFFGTPLSSTPGSWEDVYVVAFDAVDGAPLWAKGMGGGSRDLDPVVDANATNVYVAMTADSFVRDTEDQLTGLSTEQSAAVITLAVADGAQRAVFIDDGTSAPETQVHGIVRSGDAGFVICGRGSTPGTGDAAWVAIVDDDGTVVSSELYDPSDCRAVDEDDDGTLWAAFYRSGSDSAGVGPFTVTSYGGNDSVIAHLAADGAVLGAEGFGSAGSDVAGALDANGGHLVFTGDFRAAFDTDAARYEALGGGDAAAWVLTY